MKKIVISAALLFLATAFNQTFAQKGFSVSVKGTPQFSWIMNKDDKNNSNFSRKALFGTSFGVGGAYGFTNHLGVGLDVLYSLQGQKYDLSGTTYKQKSEYLKVPVFFSYNTDASKIVSFIGKLGPQVSFLTNSKLEGGSGGKIDNKNAYKSVTFGGVALAGAQFRLDKSFFLTAAARYDLDFTNAEDKNYSRYIAGRATSYNTSVGLEVGVKYLLN